MNKTEVAKSVSQHHRFASRVDIIVPFHGQYERVTRLIESVFRYTFSNVYQLILVDDGSPNENFIEDLKKVPDLQCVRLSEQKGFGSALRAGYEHSEKLQAARREKEMTEHPYIVFLQSDCAVEDVGWLSSLGTALLDLKSQGVRMVGSRTNNPMTGDLRQKGTKGSESSHVVLEDTHLAMHCFMVHRELFKHVGGFIKDYKFGWYEDEEFAFRLKKKGFKQGIAANSYVKHAGGATIKELWKKNYEARKIMEEQNRIRCIEDIKKLLRVNSSE